MLVGKLPAYSTVLLNEHLDGYQRFKFSSFISAKFYVGKNANPESGSQISHACDNDCTGSVLRLCLQSWAVVVAKWLV